SRFTSVTDPLGSELSGTASPMHPDKVFSELLSEFDSRLSRRLDRGYIENRFKRLEERYADFHSSVSEFDASPGFERGCDVCIASRTLWMCLYWCLQSFDDAVTNNLLEVLEAAFEESRRVAEETPTDPEFPHASLEKQRKIIEEMKESTRLRRVSVTKYREDRDMSLEEFTEIATQAPPVGA
ncbi:MAG: hypothetical protein AAGA96_15815, partial [Verrucomicrobiota bacterium]